MSRSIACIDYRKGKIFIAKRIETGDMGGRWEFPGGKIDEGEDFVTAIKREMKEEFGVEVEVFDKLCQVSFEHKGKLCYVDAFKVHFLEDGIERHFTLSEHTDYKWEDFSKIPSLSFVDSDMKIYELLKDRIDTL
ncbi:MAG: NUDIX domain-containing protein [Treponema sp.]|nr:NUDIX domain-containing protein [Treponema sp.]